MQLVRTAVVLAALVSAGYAQDAAKKLTKTEALSAATAKVQPDYPPMAKQLKIEGTVELEALISEAGTVEKVNIVNGNPVLTRSATDALKRWKFNPVTADGRPVKALAPVTFIFRM